MSRDLYFEGLGRKYGYGPTDYQPPSSEIPSTYKMSLIKSLPVNLSGPLPAKIYINKNCDIVFETEKMKCYYSDVSNEYIEQFSPVTE